MSVTGFEEFANAISAQSRETPAGAGTAMTAVTVLGGGDDGRMFAAIALANGAAVTLFSAYGRELDALGKAGTIALRGDGPIGNFHVGQAQDASIKITSALDEAVTGAQIILLTGPVHKQRTYAMVLADHLSDGQVLVIPNARSLGAVEIAWLLQTGGVCGGYYHRRSGRRALLG